MVGNIKKISKQTFFQILGKVVTSLSTFIILGLVARNYGEEGTGVFTLALTYLAIFYLLADFGFNAHELKTGTSRWHKLLGTRILWSGILTILAIILLPFWPFASPVFTQAVLIGSLTILASAIYTTGNLIFQGLLKYEQSLIAIAVGTLVGLGVFMFIIRLHLPIPFLFFEHLTSWTVLVIIILILVRKITKSIMPIFDGQYILKLFKDCWPLAGTLFLNVVYFRADSFLLAIFRNSSEVGIYNIAYSVFQTALVLPTFIMNSYYPMLLKSFQDVRLVGLGLLILAGAGTLLTFYLSPTVIAILTGGGFSGSVESLRILSLGFPAFFVSSLLMWILVAKNKYKTMLTIYLIGLLINLALNWLFIPDYSFYAASWITVLSEYLILVLQIASLLG